MRDGQFILPVLFFLCDFFFGTDCRVPAMFPLYGLMTDYGKAGTPGSTPSSARSRRFISIPPAYPVRLPFFPMTR